MTRGPALRSISRAILPENTKTVRIGQIPNPSFGTFWVVYPKEVKVGNRKLCSRVEYFSRT